MASSIRQHRIAMLAAQRASLLTQRVFRDEAKGLLSKQDHSPVTVGDFGAQALIISALKHNFPDDRIIAEEVSAPLHEKCNTSITSRIWELVRTTHLNDKQVEKELGGPIQSQNEMLNLLDLGKDDGGRQGRIWTIDPIDGTKGFLRGGQYAVCIALIVDGKSRLGVLACPNLPIDDFTPLHPNLGVNPSCSQTSGVLFSAIAGEGATSRPLTDGGLAEGQSISMNSVDRIEEACMCESYEASHSNHSLQDEIAQALGIVQPSVRMDSQAKYASIARGAGDIYLRLPAKNDYREKVWDHAPGEVIVREAGGIVTDIHGRPLDFGTGRTMDDNVGVVAAPAHIHAQILAVVSTVLATQRVQKL